MPIIEHMPGELLLQRLMKCNNPAVQGGPCMIKKELHSGMDVAQWEQGHEVLDNVILKRWR